MIKTAHPGLPPLSKTSYSADEINPSPIPAGDLGNAAAENMGLLYMLLRKKARKGDQCLH